MSTLFLVPEMFGDKSTRFLEGVHFLSKPPVTIVSMFNACTPVQVQRRKVKIDIFTNLSENEEIVV